MGLILFLLIIPGLLCALASAEAAAADWDDPFGPNSY